MEPEDRDQEDIRMGAFHHPTRAVGGQEDREYLAAGQGRGSGGLGRQAQQRLNSQPGNSYAKAAPWRERRAVGLRGPALGMASRRDVEDWSAEQVADWLLTVSPDSAYIDYAETFKRHRIRGANLPRLDFRLLGCMGIESIGHQIDILQAIDKLLQSTSSGTPNSRSSSNSPYRDIPTGKVVRLIEYETSLRPGGTHKIESHQHSSIQSREDGRAVASGRRPPPPNPTVKDRRYAESLPGEWDRGYRRTSERYGDVREPHRQTGARPVPSARNPPDPHWFYTSEDEDRASSLYYSRAGSCFTSSSSYSDVRTVGADPRQRLREGSSGSGSEASFSRRVQATSPLANEQWEADSRWYDDRQRRSPRRRHSNRETARRGKEVRSRYGDRRVESPTVEEEKSSRNHSTEPRYERSDRQLPQRKSEVASTTYNQQTPENGESKRDPLTDEDQRRRTTNVYLRDMPSVVGGNSINQEESQYREVSVDEALSRNRVTTSRESVEQIASQETTRACPPPRNPSQQTNRLLRSRSDGHHERQTATGVNPFDRFSSHRIGGLRAKREKSPSHQVPSVSSSDRSKGSLPENDARQRRIRKDFPAEWAVPPGETVLDVKPTPTLSNRSNLTADSGLPPSVRQSPVRSERDSQTYSECDVNRTEDQLSGRQQRVLGRRQERGVARQRRNSERQEEDVAAIVGQKQDMWLKPPGSSTNARSKSASPVRNSSESETRPVKPSSRPLQDNKGLIKHAPVTVTLSTTSKDTKEFVVHRLAAILQIGKDGLLSNVTSSESPNGKSVTLMLEMNAVRQLKQLLESDKDSLSPLNATSVQIGTDHPVTLQKPRSLMRALEHSNLRTQNSHFLKVVVVGDSACGKTSFIRAYVSNKRCTGDYNPTVFDTFDCCISIGKEPIMMQIHDTAAVEGYEKLRPESYRGSDLVVICFCIHRQSSLHNVEDYWYPEVRIHNPTAPIVVAGLQKDLRDDYEMSSRVYRTKHQPPVQGETARRICGSIHAVCYRECSSVTMEGVKELFDLIVYMAYEHKKRQCRRADNTAKCSVL